METFANNKLYLRIRSDLNCCSFSDFFNGQTHDNRTGTSRDYKVDVVRLPTSDDQADLELPGLYGVEHEEHHAEELHHLRASRNVYS